MNSHSKYKNKVDSNQQSIIDDLEKMGFVILLGHDDFLASYQGRMVLVECKNPKTTLNKNMTLKPKAIKPRQKKILEKRRDNEYSLPYIVAWYTEDVLAYFGIEGYKRKLCGDCWLTSDINSPICRCEI